MALNLCLLSHLESANVVHGQSNICPKDLFVTFRNYCERQNPESLHEEIVRKAKPIFEATF